MSLDQAQEQARLALAERESRRRNLLELDWQREEFLARQGASSLRQRDLLPHALHRFEAEQVKWLEGTLSYSNLRHPPPGPSRMSP